MAMKAMGSLSSSSSSSSPHKKTDGGATLGGASSTIVWQSCCLRWLRWLWWQLTVQQQHHHHPPSSSTTTTTVTTTLSARFRTIVLIVTVIPLVFWWSMVSVPWHVKRYRQHRIMMQRMTPPQLNCTAVASDKDDNDKTSIVTVTTTTTFGETTSLEAFTILFDLSSFSGQSHSNFQKTKALGLTRLSLASAVHWGVPLTIVTHESNRAQIRQFTAAQDDFPHVRVATIPNDELGLPSNDDNNNNNNGTTTTGASAMNWVKLVEDFKIAYLKRNLGKRLVYLELDMLFLPGVGRALQEQLNPAQHHHQQQQQPPPRPFDLALCYYPASVQRRRRAFGSINSGFIVLQSTPAVIALFAKVASILQDRFEANRHVVQGGENQKIMDDILQNTFVPPGQQYTTRFDFALPPHLASLSSSPNSPQQQEQEHSLTVHSLPVPGPFNRPFTYMWENCCDLINYDNPNDHIARDPTDGTTPIYIVHFVGPKKRTIMSSCCRDLAFPNPCGSSNSNSNKNNLVPMQQQVAYYQEWKDSCYCRETTCSSVYKTAGSENSGEDWCSTG